jgi:hypothetical protein
MTTTPRRKLRLLRGPALVLDSVDICTISAEPGLTWTIGSGPNQFLIWLGGRHPQVGSRVFVPLARARISPGVTTMVGVPMAAAFCARSRRWSSRSENACSRVAEVSGGSVEPKRYSGPGDPGESPGAHAGSRRGLSRAKAARDKAALESSLRFSDL